MRNLFLFLFTLIISVQAFAQPCISAYPYRETFESSPGGWTASGTASDWAWGSPVKPVITAAGEGTRCWIVGGLTGSVYNNGERSFLQSPCFDFTSLAHPKISFKVFWESEKNFDGADLQYSIDGGTNWLDVGDANSNSNCLGSNWYNNSSVRFISFKPGWAGNIQTSGCTPGSGSGGWLTASHDLTPLAGRPNVIFRFEFGAGTTCNNYDGFAVDDINIAESTPFTASYTYTCKPLRVVDFTNTTSCTTGISWDFGDVASGANNTSTSPNPTHTFSAPGTYTVKLTTTFATASPSTAQKQITILGVTGNIDQPVTCAGTQTAVISAAATGSTAGYTYTWNTFPTQTGPTITTGAGTFTVTATSGTACPASATITVVDPAPLVISPVISPQKCALNNGSILSNVSGGTPSYTYSWSNGASTPDITGLAAGTYSLQVTDNNGCTVNANNLTVAHDNNSLSVNLGPDANICPGQTKVLNPGSFSSYLWQDNSTQPTFSVTQTGTYSVDVTDASGCTAHDEIKIIVDCSAIYFPTAFTPNGDTKNELFGPAGNNLYAVSNYSLDIYNRYGELAFRSNDPFKKWDGRFKGKISGNETFVWIASYRLNGKDEFQKGTVTLIK